MAELALYKYQTPYDKIRRGVKDDPNNYIGSTLIDYLLDERWCVAHAGFTDDLDEISREMQRVAESYGMGERRGVWHWQLWFDKKECKKFGSNQYNISIDIAEKLFSLLCDSYQVYYVIHRHDRNHIHFLINPVNRCNGSLLKDCFNELMGEYTILCFYLKEKYGIELVVTPER